MSGKSVFKKKFKIKNPIISIKQKRQKIKHAISEQSVDSYVKFDPDNIKNEQLLPNKLQNKIITNEFKLLRNDHDTIIDKNESVEITKKNHNKCTSTDNDKCKLTKKKKVTFAADVKNEKDDQNCTAGNMKPISLNKRKKQNYLRKLKAKKNKQKNAKKCEENATALSTPRQERAIEYLMQWKNERSNWKFKKIYQLWLIKNTYNSSKISKEQFDILVEYLQTIEGKSHSLILQNANTILTEFSTSNEQQELNLSQTNKYQRARTIIQMFG